MAEREDVQDAWPSMRVHLGRSSRCDPSLQNADGVVFEEQAMRLGRCRQRVERVRPWPSLSLWIGHATEDGRQCWMVQAGGDPATGRPYGGGSCDETDQSGPIRPDGPMWTIERPNIEIMHVRIYDDAITRVQIELKDAAGVSLPVVSGHALGALPKGAHLRAIVGQNGDGEVVARWVAPS